MPAILDDQVTANGVNSNIFCEFSEYIHHIFLYIRQKHDTMFIYLQNIWNGGIFV